MLSYMYKKGEKMPSNRMKYTEEIRRQTAQFIIESGRSATSVGE